MSIQGTVGFRIVRGGPRPADHVVQAFQGKATSDLADAMGRFYFMDPGVVSRTGLSLCGVAVTVNARPGDLLMVQKALEVVAPGDVLAVSTNGNTTNAVFGELMGRTAVAAGLAGVVVDGGIRDVEGLKEIGFPVFSRSVTPGACDRDGPGEINVPIACGNVVVMPGDILVGDEDGVVVVPRKDASEVLERLQDLESQEKKRLTAIQAGELFPPEVDEILRARGVLE